MTRAVVAAALMALSSSFVALEACSTFESTTDGSPDGGGDASSACPPLQPFCDGGVELKCPGLEGRCLFYCPTPAAHDNAQLTCAAWGGCLLGVQDAPHLNCAHVASQIPAAGVVVDLVQNTTAQMQAEGWAPACPGAPTPNPIPWGPKEPDDGNDAGKENGTQQCAFLSPAGSLADLACPLKLTYVCDRPR